MSIEMQSKVHQRGAAPSGLITFGVPDPKVVRRWQGASTPECGLFCFGSGQQFDAISVSGFRAVTLSFSEQAFFRLAEDFGFDEPAHAKRPGVADLSQFKRPARFLTRNLAAFMATAGQRNTDVEEEIGLAVLLAAASSPVRPIAQSQRLRHRALRRALELIEARIDDPPSIRELCVQSGASWPTLHRAFVEHFEMGPKAYLSKLRLNRARADLLAANDRTRVADVANRWGFWHLGQFAHDYRELFNRLPSEDLTLRN